MDTRIRRLVSMLLDHLSMTFVVMPIMAGVFLLLLFISWTMAEISEELFLPSSAAVTIAFFPFIIYFLKDNYRGKSIGKRVMGLQVVHRKTNETANGLQCFLRNLLIPLWPLEVLVTLVSPTRRLGDLIANTKVIKAEKESPLNIWAEVKQSKFTSQSLTILSIGVIYCIMLYFAIYSWQ